MRRFDQLAEIREGASTHGPHAPQFADRFGLAHHQGVTAEDFPGVRRSAGCESWLPPKGMKDRAHAFDFRAGGRYRWS